MDGAEPCPCGYDAAHSGSSSVLPVGTLLRSDDGAHEYTLGLILGTGAFAVTYLGRDASDGKRVAIKEYLPQELAGRVPNSTHVRPHSKDKRDYFAHGLQRFINESNALKQFAHPNIVDVKAHFTANDTAYLVMPYYEAVTLGAYIEDHGALEPEVAVIAMLGVLDGLRHIHNTRLNERRWTHRDVKPENILLRKDGGPLLIDFGAARAESIDEKRALSVVLTPGYAPYEQFVPGDRSDGPWVDVYGCAATLYDALTGAQPVDSRLRHDAVGRGQPDPLEPPHKLVPAIEPKLSRAVMQGLALDYRYRPQDAGAFAQLLREPPSAPFALIQDSAQHLRNPWVSRAAAAVFALLALYFGISNGQLRVDILSTKAAAAELQERLDTANKAADQKLAAAEAGQQSALKKGEHDKAQYQAMLANLSAAETAPDEPDTSREDNARTAELERVTSERDAALKRQKALEFLSGGRTIRTSYADGGMVAMSPFNVSVSGGQITVSDLNFSIDIAGYANTVQGKDIANNHKARFVVAVYNSRTDKWNQSENISWTYVADGRNYSPGRTIKIAGDTPCTADDIVNTRCLIGVFVAGANGAGWQGANAVIRLD